MENLSNDLFKNFEDDVICNMEDIRGGQSIDTKAGTFCDGTCWTSDVEFGDCGCTAYYGIYNCPGCGGNDTIPAHAMM